VFKIDLAGATNVSVMSGTDAAKNLVGKTLFKDVTAALNAGGVPLSEVPAKIEGLSFGQDVDVSRIALFDGAESTIFDGLPASASGVL
jgi:hypothetical protein